MADHRQGPVLVTGVQLWWYVVTLPMILGLMYISAAGVVSPWFVPLGLFALIFWLISLVFALVALIRQRRKKP